MGVVREGPRCGMEAQPWRAADDWILKTPKSLSQLKGPLTSPLIYREDVRTQASHTPAWGSSLSEPLLPVQRGTWLPQRVSSGACRVEAHPPRDPWCAGAPMCQIPSWARTGYSAGWGC